MEQIHGISLLVSKYKDNDSIINILTEDGLVAVLGRGINNYKSKNFVFSHPFIEGDFEIYKGKVGGYKLKDGRLYNDFSSSLQDYNSLISLDFISELTLKVIDGIENYKECYQALKFVLENLDKKCTYLAYYLLKIIDFLGIRPNISEEFQYYFDLESGVFTDNPSNNTIAFSVDDFCFIKNVYDHNLIVENNANYQKIIYWFYLFLNQKFNVNLNSINYFVAY